MRSTPSYIQNMWRRCCCRRQRASALFFCLFLAITKSSAPATRDWSNKSRSVLHELKDTSLPPRCTSLHPLCERRQMSSATHSPLRSVRATIGNRELIEELLKLAESRVKSEARAVQRSTDTSVMTWPLQRASPAAACLEEFSAGQRGAIVCVRFASPQSVMCFELFWSNLHYKSPKKCWNNSLLSEQLSEEGQHGWKMHWFQLLLKKKHVGCW